MIKIDYTMKIIYQKKTKKITQKVVTKIQEETTSTKWSINTDYSILSTLASWLQTLASLANLI